MNKFLIIIITFVVVLGMVFLLVLPKYNQLLAAQESITQKKAEYESKFIYYTKVSELIKNIESKEDALKKVDTALPSSISLAQILYFLQEKAVVSGLVVKSTIFSPVSTQSTTNQPISMEKKESEVHDMDFTIDLVGNYEGLKTFIASLENSARLFQITSIAFSSADGAGSLTASPTSTQPKPPVAEKIYTFKLTIKTNTY